MKVRKPIIFGRLSFYLSGVGLMLLAAASVGLMIEYGDWPLIKTVIISIIGVILVVGGIVEDRRFNKRNLIHHDPEKRMTTIVYGDEE